MKEKTIIPEQPITPNNKTWYDKGDKIAYQYTHHINSRSTTQIVRFGVFIRFVRKKNPYEWNPNRRAVVQLEGNKNPSIVWESQISHV